MVLLFNVTLSIGGISSPLSVSSSDEPQLTQLLGNLLLCPEAFQSLKSGLHHVVGIIRANTLGKDVADSRCFHDSTDSPAGDNSGSGSGRFQENFGCAVLTSNFMGDCAVDDRHLHQEALARSTPLRIASGTSLALPKPNPTRPCPSPTTTTALKENLLPPLTTLATRLR